MHYGLKTFPLFKVISFDLLLSMQKIGLKKSSVYLRNWTQKNILSNQFRTNLKDLFHCALLSKGPRNLLRKTCKGWGPIINPRSSFVDPSVLRFNARFTRGKSHWGEIISETSVPIFYTHAFMFLQFQTSVEIKQQ